MEPNGLDARICDGTIIRRASVFAALALLSGHVFAQDVPRPAEANPSKPDASQPVDEVIVRGRRMSELRVELEKFVLEFVNKVTAPAAGRGYARWHRFLCVGVNNLQADAAQYIVDRISKEALELGLEPGEPGCQPEVIVIFTTDAKMLATFLVKHYKRVFLPGMGEGGMARNRDALDAFTQTDKPVRWWATSMPVDARVFTAAVTVPGSLGGPAYTSDSGGGSRIHSMTVDALRQVIIIVDGTKLKGTTWQQLGDYLAVVSLAQIRLETDPTAFDSILNLFANPKAYSGLTDWDRTYLQTLYSNDQERVPAMQKIDLINRMTFHALNGE